MEQAARGAWAIRGRSEREGLYEATVAVKFRRDAKRMAKEHSDTASPVEGKAADDVAILRVESHIGVTHRNFHLGINWSESTVVPNRRTTPKISALLVPFFLLAPRLLLSSSPRGPSFLTRQVSSSAFFQTLSKVADLTGVSRSHEPIKIGLKPQTFYRAVSGCQIGVGQICETKERASGRRSCCAVIGGNRDYFCRMEFTNSNGLLILIFC